MGKRRSDADGRRFFDEFEKVRVSRFRATGVIDPSRREDLIPFPNGKTKLIATAHSAMRNGGGWSFFRCPKCGRRATTLYLIDDAPRCCKCCITMNIRHRSEYGFGRDERRRASDKALDQLIAKLETSEPLRFKPEHARWLGKSRIVANSQSLAVRMQRSMISLRLNQLASQQATEHGYQPLAAAKQLIELTPIWRATSTERLLQALDKAQIVILAALKSDDPKQRLNAAKLMMRTKQARERGW